MKNIMINISKCCHPLPGDDIIGFVTIGHGVSVHRQDCPNIVNLQKEDKERLIEVKWDEKRKDLTYPVNLEIKAFDRVGLLKDILTKISDLNTNIIEANVKTKVDGSLMTAYLVVDVRDTEHLNLIINTIKKLNDIFDVYRINK
jgi:GTP pyrophosphokinase